MYRFVPDFDTMLTRPPPARPNSGANWLVTTWNSRTASWLMVSRVFPFSCPLLSAPSTEMLLLRLRWPLKLRPLPWPDICWPVTPATVVEKSRKLRPLIGRLLISLLLTTVPSEARPTSTMGVSWVTVTVCSSRAIGKTMSTVATWPTWSVRPERSTVAKPSSETAIL